MTYLRKNTGFTLIEILIAMAVLSISMITIMASVLKIEQIYTYDKDLTRLVHIAESRLNRFNGLKNRNVYSFHGKVKDMPFFWTIRYQDFYRGIIRRVCIDITGSRSDERDISLCESIIRLPSEKKLKEMRWRDIFQ